MEMMLLPALGGGSEASKRGPTPAGRRAVERQMGTGWLVPSQQGLGPQLLWSRGQCSSQQKRKNKVRKHYVCPCNV